MRLEKLFLGCVFAILCACGAKDMGTEPIGEPSEANQKVLTPDDLHGDWAIISLNREPALWVTYDSEDERPRLSFGPPCYEQGEGHCNRSFDGGWEPAEKRTGRLSLSGYSGCNWFGAEAYIEHGILFAKPAMSTQRGCGNIATQESALYRLLANTPQISIEADILTLTSEEDSRLTATRITAD